MSNSIVRLNITKHKETQENIKPFIKYKQTKLDTFFLRTKF